VHLRTVFVTPGNRRVPALLFLLAFVLGGLALPVVHQVDHFLDHPDAPLHEEASFLPTSEAGLHDCSLCDVRLVAADSERAEARADASTVDKPTLVVQRTLVISVRTFDGRAPPVLS
jgi:hypothetical protein